MKVLVYGSGVIGCYLAHILCTAGNECIYAKILGRRGLMKLGVMCCHADIINYGNLPYTDFIRTQTLCQGGEMCDFRFVRHQTDAGDGWDRTKSI